MTAGGIPAPVRKSLALRIAAAFCRVWVFLYTLGLPPGARNERRELIASDNWEQAWDAAGCSSWSAALDVIRRCLIGMPSDLTWRLSRPQPAPAPLVWTEQRREAMTERQAFLVLTVLCGFAWALVAVILASPTTHSLAFAGAVLTAVALAGWALEIRTDDGEAGPSFWPPAVAGGVAAIGAGMAVRWEYAGLFAALPMAVLTSKAWLEAAASSAAPSTAVMPVPLAASSLALRAGAGAAIAVELPEGRQVSRRFVLLAGLWLGLGTSVAAFAASVVDFLWERSPAAFGGVIDAGPVDRFAPGTKNRIVAGKFWLVNLTEAQGGPGFLALWQKCPHLGCTVPWEENFTYTDAATGEKSKGWFRCPCHQSTYNHAGVRVYGPAPRSMDRMELTINPETGRIEVDTGSVSKGTPDNAAYAVRPPVA